MAFFDFVLDEEDVNYLAGNLSRDQLLREIHNADVREGVARMWAEDHDVYYWREFGKVCRQALQEHRKRQPKPTKGRSLVKTVKEAHDIVDIVGGYTNLRKSGKEHTGSCPFHEDRQPSLRVSEEKQVFYCFSCGRKGDVIDFVGEIEGLNVKEACLLLAGR